MKLLYLLVLSVLLIKVKCHLHLDWDATNPAFDAKFYEQFLDTDLCTEQLAVIRNDTLLALQFIESGLRFPRSILEGSTIDLGNYFQCINIDHQTDELNDNIDGKYCLIQVPFNQDLQIPELLTISKLPATDIPEWLPKTSNEFDLSILTLSDNIPRKIKHANDIESSMKAITGQRSNEATTKENLNFRLALCVPKVCTTKQWVEGFLENVTSVGLQYNDIFCRVKNDKPWVPADYVAIVIFSLLGFVTVLSTSYDLWHTFFIKTDSKSISPYYRCFSLYTNGKRVTTFRKVPGTLECVDGIRVLSMCWIILGHCFSTLPPRINNIGFVSWIMTIGSTYVTGAVISVDTFFLMSGMLLVYTTAEKLTGMKLLKNLHLFYLHRLLRIFPLLATAVLLQASFLYRLADGPIWTSPAEFTDRCRNYWWSTLLHISNYVNTSTICLPHSWYLATDMQMHILSPLVLFWLFSGKKSVAWIALIGALIACLAAATTYNFINKFTSALITANRTDEQLDYIAYYYLNTLPRAPPFFIGLIFGYLLHVTKGTIVEMKKITALVLWICAFGMAAMALLSSHPMKSPDWDNQTLDSLINSFARPIWAIGIGWVIFACARGYGGPINWFLSHRMFKLPSRLSYGLYIFHYPMLYITSGTATAPFYFTQIRVFYRFFSELSVAFILAFCLTVFIDSPFSTIFKLVFGEGPKQSEQLPNKENRTINRTSNDNNTDQKEM